MAAPTPYTRTYSFSDYQANNPSQPLPGPQVDNELENIEQSLGAAIAAVNDVRRADGALINGIVTLDSLAPEVRDEIGEGALASAAAAAASADASASSAVASSNSATASAGSATAASTSAGQAATARNEANTARDLADSARTGAQTARDFAAQWASNPENTPVDDGVNLPDYSSYHWAQVALGAAAGALPDGSVTEPKLSVGVATKLNGALQGANDLSDVADTVLAAGNLDLIKRNTVALLIADTILNYSAGAGKTAVITGQVIEAGGFRYSVAASGASDHHITTAGGVKLYVLPLGDRVDADAFGFAGDGSDETALLQKLSSAGSGYNIKLGRAQTYLSTEEFTVGDNTDLDFRGSTINFGCVGAKRNLAIVGNNVRVHGGSVKNVVGTTGQEGTYQTPITIMRYPQLPGAMNVTVEDMTIETVCPNGNGIAVFGDTSNVIIRNIHYPDSAFMGIPIMAHWSFNGDWQTVPPKTTVSQRNIVIENIECGDLSYTTGTEGAAGLSAIWLSAAYNVKVSNLNIKSMPHGKAVTVYAGDWGFQYDGALEQAFGSSGITIENVRGKVQTGLFVSMKNTLDPPLVIWPSFITVRQMHVQGQGGLTSLGNGIFINAGRNVVVEDSTFDGFYNGVNAGSDSSGFEMRRCTVRNSYRDGLISTTTADARKIKDCRFEGNNTSNAASVGDINLQATVGTVIDGNTFNSPKCSWNVRAANTVSRLRVLNNHSDAASLSCFSFGSSPDSGIVGEYRNNTASFAPTGGVRSGQRIVPLSSTNKYGAVNTMTRLCVGDLAPTVGTWNVGDIVHNDGPTAGGAMGWVCTVAGTPGTWKAMANIAA